MSFSGSTFGNYSKKWLIAIGILELVLAGVFVFIGFTLQAVPFGGAGAMGMYLTAGILGLTGIILVIVGVAVGRRAAATSQILQTGIAGTATITSLTQTGMYLNEQPQIAMDLIVSVPGRPPYAARHKSFVPLLLLSRLTSGAPLSVKVDPADPQKIVVDWQAAPAMPGPVYGQPVPAQGYGQPVAAYGQPVPPPRQPLAAYGQSTPDHGQPTMPLPQPVTPYGQPTMAIPQATWSQPLATGQPSGVAQAASSAAGSTVDESLGQVQAALTASGVQAASPYSMPGQANVSVEQLRAYLRAAGLPGHARIDKLQDTGQIVGDERLYTMQVTLEIPGRPPRQTSESAAMVPLRAMHKMRLGETLPVRVDPNNDNLMMFDWDSI